MEKFNLPIDKEIIRKHKLIMWRNKKNPFFVVFFHYSAFNDDEKWIEEKKKRMLSQANWEREMELNFDIVSTSNIVFPNFSDKNITDKSLPITGYPIIRGWDFGFLNASVIFAQKIGSQLYIFDELVVSKTYTKDLVVRVLQLTEQYLQKERFKIIDCCDPKSAVQKSEKSEITNLEILLRYNIRPIYKTFPINYGINLLSMLIDKKVQDEYGLMVLNKCRFTIEAFKGGYIWEAPNKPAKDGFYDHLMDALRYIVVNNFTLEEIIEYPVEQQKIEENITWEDYLKTIIKEWEKKRNEIEEIAY